jgi:hypothetical protein
MSNIQQQVANVTQTPSTNGTNQIAQQTVVPTPTATTTTPTNTSAQPHQFSIPQAGNLTYQTPVMEVIK